RRYFLSWSSLSVTPEDALFNLSKAGNKPKDKMPYSIEAAASSKRARRSLSRISNFISVLENHFQCEAVLARIVACYSGREFHTLEHWAALEQVLNLGRALRETRDRNR